MNILITGGCGYIGSHTSVELLQDGYNIIIVDDLSNSNSEVITKIEKITQKKVKFYKGDVANYNFMEKIFNENSIDAVIHFAGFKAVGESVQKPLKYYRNNLDTTLTLLEIMNKYNCKKIVFSSSATVYGNPKNHVYKESMGRGICTNPYGNTKSIIEQILEDVSKADPSMCISILRYFNPIGAHDSGLIGENPNGIPNNLMPYIVKVANGELPCLNVFGNDYNTNDGTGVRDYIHVVDLAIGHIKSLEKITPGINIYNLGNGKGYSVLEIVDTFEKINGVKIPYKIVDRRAGDLAIYYADPSKALKELKFKTTRGIEDMCKSSWNFIIKNK